MNGHQNNYVIMLLFFIHVTMHIQTSLLSYISNYIIVFIYTILSQRIMFSKFSKAQYRAACVVVPWYMSMSSGAMVHDVGRGVFREWHRVARATPEI